MKKIDFAQLKVETSIDCFEDQDLRKDIGNALHRVSESVPMSDLARKIYYSEEAIEVSDDDCKTMMNLLGRLFKKFIIDALIRSTQDVGKEETK